MTSRRASASSIRHERTALGPNCKRSQAARRLVWAFRALTIALGTADAWRSRLDLCAVNLWTQQHPLCLDAVSYLDISDAYAKGDWRHAVNPYWSPLYSWLLAAARLLVSTSPRLEVPMLHLVNLAGLVAALLAFELLLRQLIAHAATRVPDWVLVGLLYPLFVWSSLGAVTVSAAVPDLWVSAAVYVAGAMLVGVRRGRDGIGAFLLMGLAMGGAYLAKSSMLPIGLVLVAAGLWARRAWSGWLPRAVAGSVGVAVLAVPWIFAVGSTRGRAALGSTARLNYAWALDGVTALDSVRGETARSASLPNVPRLVHREPDVRQFAGHLGGTYPPWYDPDRCLQGIAARPSVRAQLGIAARVARVYYPLLVGDLSFWITAVVALYALGSRHPAKGGRNQREWMDWPLAMPALAALGMYWLVGAEPRYVGPFVVLLAVAALTNLRLPSDGDLGRAARTVAAAGMLLGLVAAVHHAAYVINKHTPSKRDWQVAQMLNRSGLPPGSGVAGIWKGDLPDVVWARLARVHVVADAIGSQADEYWASGRETQKEVLEAFARAGALAVVANDMPGPPPPGWWEVGTTGVWVHWLR